MVEITETSPGLFRITNTYAKHAHKGEIIQPDGHDDLFRMTELQDKAYQVRAMNLFYEDEHASHGVTPVPTYFNGEMPCTIYYQR